MSRLAPIIIRSPHANDIVDDPVQISGLAVAFESVINVRACDETKNIIVEKFFNATGSSMWKNFQITLPLSQKPPTPFGSLEVFAISAKDGSEINKVIIPVVFGKALIDPYHGFYQHEVVPGDTLSAIAKKAYGKSAFSDRIFEANQDQLTSPNKISPGQFLRIPI
ncbi:MAG: Immunoglobulin-like domain of bacterial spore germination [Phormidesmis priestleyi Ana]|uniref:Immunoglobulin-like domain of bacterial spore germination n=1 Tax=Phormidesmis priestleyi Ana TaxID=1666911 RepID=A0A0P7ZGF7_9CYAN|nr:MAG: Immunoglobulin-like domain of bacterial spore germination [Phormidesmis priestleyi Ana]